MSVIRIVVPAGEDPQQALHRHVIAALNERICPYCGSSLNDLGCCLSCTVPCAWWLDGEYYCWHRLFDPWSGLPIWPDPRCPHGCCAGR